MAKEMSLGQAVALYLTSLSPEERESQQLELYRFVRWYGWDRPIASLKPQEIANFAEKTGEDKKLEGIKAFLAYAKKEGLTPTNLVAHLRLRKAGAKASSGQRAGALAPQLTSEGYAQLEVELENLRQESLRVVEEVRLAREDKDFKENAPLDAARERLRQVAGRIKELEAVLGRGVGARSEEKPSRVELGCRVRLRDMSSGELVEYYLVNPEEVNLAQGWLSRASPLGKALLGKGEGEVVGVATPGGSHRYEIERISHPD